MKNEELIKTMKEHGGYVEKRWIYGENRERFYYGYVKAGRGMAIHVPDFEEIDKCLFRNPECFYNGKPEECWYLKG